MSTANSNIHLIITKSKMLQAVKKILISEKTNVFINDRSPYKKKIGKINASINQIKDISEKSDKQYCQNTDKFSNNLI